MDLNKSMPGARVLDASHKMEDLQEEGLSAWGPCSLTDPDRLDRHGPYLFHDHRDFDHDYDHGKYHELH